MKKFLGIILFVLIAFSLFAQYASDLFISEYVEGSSYHKAIEIFNGTGVAVDLSQYSLKKQTNGSGEFGNELVLQDSLQNNDVYVIVYDHGGDGDLTGEPFVDLATTSQAMTFNGNDAVALCKNGNILDVVGVVDSSDDWGKNVTLVRNSYVASPSAVYIPTDWTEYPQDTFDYLGYHDFQGGLDHYLIVTSPNGGEEWEQGSIHNITWTSLNYDGNIRIELLTTSNNRDILVESTENDGQWEWNIPSDQQIADDYIIRITSIDSLNLTDDSDAPFSIVEPIPYTEYLIYDIQHSENGPSPHEGERVITSGVVTAIFYNSFYIQDGEGAWNGVCVYDTNEQIQVGDKITLKAIVQEYNDKTELTNISDVEILGQYPIPQPLTITTADLATTEDYEGVLVRIQNATVTNDSLGYGEWEITDDSGTPCRVDDLGDYDYEPLNNDIIYSIEGVVDYSYGNYKLQPRTDADINRNGLVILPNSLDFETFDDAVNGLTFTIYNYADTTMTINSILSQGQFEEGEAVWSVDLSNIDLPYSLQPNSSISIAVAVGLPVHYRDDYLISQIPIETSEGDYSVTLYLNSILIQNSENDAVSLNTNNLKIYPNPFITNSKNNVSINFTIQKSGNTKVQVYNLKGELIKTVANDYMKAGNYSIKWNTTKNKGITSGIYFIKLENNKTIVTKKFILIK